LSLTELVAMTMLFDNAEIQKLKERKEEEETENK
jgi:hypothetical protein